MHCIYCGAKLTDDAAFCMKCGKPVVRAPETPTPTPVAPPPARPDQSAPRAKTTPAPTTPAPSQAAPPPAGPAASVPAAARPAPPQTSFPPPTQAVAASPSLLPGNVSRVTLGAIIARASHVLVLICFGLPWVGIGCMGQSLKVYNGFQLMGGRGGAGLIFTILLLTFAFVATFKIMGRWTYFYSLAATVASAAVFNLSLFMLAMGLVDELGEAIGKAVLQDIMNSIGDNPETSYGLYGVGIFYITALVGEVILVLPLNRREAAALAGAGVAAGGVAGLAGSLSMSDLASKADRYMGKGKEQALKGFEWTKTFVLKHKKQVILGAVALVLLVVLISLGVVLFDYLEDRRYAAMAEEEESGEFYDGEFENGEGDVDYAEGGGGYAGGGGGYAEGGGGYAGEAGDPEETGGDVPAYATGLPTPCYVICVSAMGSEQGAFRMAENLRNQGYSADYLWIPDYASLSGAQMFLVFIGPYTDLNAAKNMLAGYKRKNSSAYGIKVDTRPGRMTF